MMNCIGHMKDQTKYIELNYDSMYGHDGMSQEEYEQSAVFNGFYDAESEVKAESLLRNAIGFFKSGLAR